MRAVIFVAMLLVSSSILGRTLSVVAKQIEGFVDSPVSGFLVEQLRSLEGNSIYRFDIHVVPPARAVKLFETGQYDILLPHPQKPDEFSVSLYTKNTHAFYHKDTGVLRSWEDLEGLDVVVTRGYVLDKKLLDGKAQNVYESVDDMMGLKMLSKKRVQAMIGEERSLSAIIESTGMSELSYDDSSPLVSSGVYLLFWQQRVPLSTQKEINNLLQARQLSLKH